MIKIAHCDDNSLQRDILQDMLETYAGEKQYGIKTESFATGEDLIKHVRSVGSFDIYILDIIMPSMNGLDVAATLRFMKDSGIIIFLTSSLDYGIASYDVGAFYYLVKPLNREKLYSILDRAFENLVNSENRELIIRAENGNTSVNPFDISYVNLSDRTLMYHMKDGRIISSINIRTSFRDAISVLLEDGRFALCGVATAVNLAEIDTMDSESVLLRTGDLLYPPKSSCGKLRTAWKAFHKN